MALSRRRLRRAWTARKFQIKLYISCRQKNISLIRGAFGTSRRREALNALRFLLMSGQFAAIKVFLQPAVSDFDYPGFDFAFCEFSAVVTF